ncbi:MAG: rhodanese-like domain-containing protein [Bacteroidales bacterium]|nr:rhodanese-like domain-containing protein [Bacteroidales bacterium]
MKNKKFLNILMLVALALSVVISSCRKDDDDIVDPVVTDYHSELTTYLAANSMDLTSVLTGWTISAHDLDSIGIANYFIIDLRNSTDFGLGHIDGAHNSTLGNILTVADSANGTPIVIACYTGQTAAWAHVALRLSGYSDCKILLFGMSAWNSDFDSWTTNIGDVGIGNSNWSTTNTIQTPVTFAAPSLTCTATTGAGILQERVNYILTLGFQGVTNTDVLTTPTNYFINNYWVESDVNAMGHIVGAYRIKETLNLTDNGFLNLNSAGTVVTYCYTGQTSSAITAYLTILGYTAKSLKFGANGMIYSNMTGHKWTASGSYPYVTN